MNAIIALCHFCEFHGPSVLFCTQAFHCEAHDPLKGTCTSVLECGACIKRNFTRFGSETPGSESAQESRQSWASTRPSQCEACKSLDHNHAGYISIDHEAHISYYSNRSPEQPELYSVVRQACVRSLSCEVCPGREGPMFFGEESSGYVFTHTFFLKDTQSRGFQRWYSLIAVMKDRIYLVNSWPFLVSHFRELIDELQAKATGVYDAEHAASIQKGQHIQPSANGLFLTPDIFRRQRGGNKTYRGIADLLRDKDLFATLHQRFSWMLKACGNRITEKLLEGPPKEELLTDLEAQLEEDDDQEDTDTEKESDTPEEEDTRGPVFSSLRHILKVLGSQHFHLLAFHVIQGNQVIVRGEKRKTVESVLNCLKVLIPSGCCSCIPYSTKYKDSWQCNFLGLAPGVEIPPHVLSSDLFVLLDIISPRGHVPEGPVADQSRDDEHDFPGYGFVVCGKENATDPTILQKVEEALDNDSLSDAVFDQLLICLKEEWMDKVKVVFKFARSGNSTSEDKEKLLKILGAKSEDEIVLKFWMTGLNKQYRSHLLTCSSAGSTS
ncbi:folliculin-like isoform X1 [Orbicella faveolata]|uniref:folliculin-like isoform X1 n=1 Tax=Orbicella faveolata TaxID=48498 RepID=UPI0009E2EA4C|nr:folliculin-like isoform X1 [Orbicella faveolata]